jgi:hypothetical protein
MGMKLVILIGALALSHSAFALAQEPCEAQRVLPPPGFESTDFGYRVQTNGTQWIVGDSRALSLCSGSPFSCTAGAVTVFDLVDGRLQHAQTIVPSDIEFADMFGVDIDVQGDRLVVGSLNTRSSRVGDRPGTVFTYEHDGERWVEVDRIEPPITARSGFGNAVELIGDNLIVTPESSQRFFVYERAGDGWALKQQVEAPEPLIPSGAGFGGPWAAQDDWVITSAYADRRIRLTGGTVFIYRRQPDGMLELTQEISAVDERMYLGATLAFDGQTLVVGAPAASRDHEFEGVVQFYEYDGERWDLAGELVSSSGAYNHQFGQTVALSGDTLLVNAFNERTADTLGTVHRFDRQPGGPWVAVGTLDPNPPSHVSRYGGVLTTNGRHALVGAYAGNAAYFFELTCVDCKPDLDADGALTVFDFLAYLNLFQDGDPLADFDGDGELTIFDFLAFQTAFEAGCE